ncbi:MAG: hypothetical protein QOF33_1469 [Thermomicrobiales bacterium]|jgi:hypothetical protein|nr:hypothetical protein [Thermomicrobiales bacterium]
MSAWHRRALDSFPSLRRELRDREYSIYHLFFDLLPMARDAHETADLATLTRIYAFAEWCYVQHACDLWNAAAVAFNEHVFDEGTHAPWEQIVPWLAPSIIRDVWTLWEVRLSPSRLDQLRTLIAGHTKNSKVTGT